jgi:hypothetical protein
MFWVDCESLEFNCRGDGENSFEPGNCLNFSALELRVVNVELHVVLQFLDF